MEFLRWVRDERKFENPEALKAQILRDVNSRADLFPAAGATRLRRAEPRRSWRLTQMRENQERKEAL